MADTTPTPLNQCAQQILCGLSTAALQVIQTLINGQVAVLQSQITFYQTQLLQYDILAIPARAAQTTLQSVVNNVRNSVAVLPAQLVVDCVDLGQFNLNLQESIDVVLGVSEDNLFEIQRLLSFQDELQSQIDQLNSIITQYTQIQDVITICRKHQGA